ncbi:MAG: hypothetical protein CVV39_02400 [Planctomycetes bacterium HGW-Planctomycetes-1]|nr:MAG: hypothetical protein CVV39_02400 [Planctomycetes bacterium HGW-Planctomycetes-1]
MVYIEKKKEGNKNIWVFKYCALYYWLMWPTIIVSIFAWQSEGNYLGFVAAILWILLISLAIPYWPSIFKLRKVMKEKGIQASGSKYSLSNPLRYEWEDPHYSGKY